MAATRSTLLGMQATMKRGQPLVTAPVSS